MMDCQYHNIQSFLRLPTIKIFVCLGYEDNERQQPQQISLDLCLKFSHLPSACQNDELTDTICYHQLAEDLQQYCQSRSFKLIEHLAWQLFGYLTTHLTLIDQLSLTINKPLPLSHFPASQFRLSNLTHLPPLESSDGQ